MDWESIVSSVAPMIGTALGGPLGGLAAKAACEAFGIDPKEKDAEKQLAEAVKVATPEQLLKLKQAEQQFKKDMKSLDIDIMRITADDRDSARKMFMQTKTKVVPALALTTFLTFGAFNVALFTGNIPENGHDLLIRTQGVLDTLVGTVFAYYFGSSNNSAAKDNMLHASTPTSI